MTLSCFVSAGAAASGSGSLHSQRSHWNAAGSTRGMERCPQKCPSSFIITAVTYLVLFGAVTATMSDEMPQDAKLLRPLEERYELGSWTHEPMYVDEPRWILSSPMRHGRTDSEDENDDHFWVTRGKKWRSMTSNTVLPGYYLDSGHWVVYPDESKAMRRGFWGGRGEKRTLNSLLYNEPFWINRGKRGEVTTVLKEPFWVNRGKKTVGYGGMDHHNLQEAGQVYGHVLGGDGSQNDIAVGDEGAVASGGELDLEDDPSQDVQKRGAVRKKRAVAVGSLESNKKSDVGITLNNDPFFVNRGKKSQMGSLLNNGDQFWVNRGKKSELQSLLEGGGQFYVNRGKKSELESILGGDQFYVNRGKKSELQSLLGDQFFVNRGKKSELQSLLEGGGQFYVNRGKKSELQSLLGGDQFYVNRGKKSELQSLLGADQFFVNRGKKNELQSLLEGGDQFYVNRGKKGELQSLLGGDQFYVNRGKKGELESLLGGDQFYVNRGKKGELESLLGGDQFYVNRGKKGELESLLGGDQFYVNRGKKNDIESLLSGDQFYVNRGKKNELQSALGGGNQFWVNRGKRNDLQSVLGGAGSPFWVNRGKKSEFISQLNGGDQFWLNQGRTNSMKPILNSVDRLWPNRGGGGESQSVLNRGDPFSRNIGNKVNYHIPSYRGEQDRVKTNKNNNRQPIGMNFWQSPHSEDDLLHNYDISEPFFKKHMSPVGGIPWTISFWNDRDKKDLSPIKSISDADRFFANQGRRGDAFVIPDRGENLKGEHDEPAPNRSRVADGVKTDSNIHQTLKMRKRRYTEDDRSDRISASDRALLMNRKKRAILGDDRPFASLSQYPFAGERGRNNGDPFWVSKGMSKSTLARKRRDSGITSSASVSLTEITDRAPKERPASEPFRQEHNFPSHSQSPSRSQHTKSTRQKRRARMPKIEIQKTPSTPTYEDDSSDDPFQSDTDLNSVDPWSEGESGQEWPAAAFWDDGEGLPQDSAVVLKDTAKFRQLGDKLVPREDLFWVNRGKRKVSREGPAGSASTESVSPNHLASKTLISLDGASDLGEKFWMTRP